MRRAASGRASGCATHAVSQATTRNCSRPAGAPGISSRPRWRCRRRATTLVAKPRLSTNARIITGVEALTRRR